MYKLINLEKKEYENFVKNNKYKSHFLQSYAWGEFSKKMKNLTPYYLGLVNEDKTILATALLLRKRLPLKYSYFYSPRGFVLDYENTEIFNIMTKKVIEFVKNKKGIFLKIDPDIIKKSFNYLDEENTINHDPKKIFNMIFYGKSGIGKTTLALTLMNELDIRYRMLNATINSKKDFEYECWVSYDEVMQLHLSR